MWTVKVKQVAQAEHIADKVVAAMSAEVNRTRGFQKGDWVTLVNSVSRMMALATGRAKSPSSMVAVDLMVSRTKEGRRFTWTCQIDVEPAKLDEDQAPGTDLVPAADDGD